MKKFAALILALVLALPMVAMAEAVQSPAVDAFTSSVMFWVHATS